MSVSFEVNANIELGCGMMQPFDTGRGTDDGKSKRLCDVIGTGTIGIRGLNYANLQIISKAGITGKVADERCGKSGDAVSIKKSESMVRIIVIINKSIGVPVKRTESLIGPSFETWGSSLFGLDIICTTLRILSIYFR